MNFSEQLFLAFIQVPSSTEGPGSVAAEALFDRVEQVDFLFTRGGGELIPLKISWVPPDHS